MLLGSGGTVKIHIKIQEKIGVKKSFLLFIDDGQKEINSQK